MRALLAAAAAMIVAASMSLVPVSRAVACTCAMVSEKQATAGADVVFDGVAVSSKPPLIIQSSGDPVEYIFVVENVVKGAASGQVTVTTALSGASCGQEFQVGERWRVFATSEGSERSVLHTNLCAGNRLMDHVATVPSSAGDGSLASVLLPAVASLGLIGLLLVLALSVFRPGRT